MKQFFQNRMDELDADDVIRYIKKQLEGGSQYRGGGSGGGNYHQSKSEEEELKQLAKVCEMIKEFFEIQGLDPRTYTSQSQEESYRRGGGR